MNRRNASLFGMLYIALSMILMGFTLNTRIAMAQNTIYVRADGSIDPPAAPITTPDKITYTFTGNIGETLVIQRNDTVIDVAGFTIQGTGSGTGVSSTSTSNVTIKNANIRGFYNGIVFISVSSSGIINNNITNNSLDGISFTGSHGNTIAQNNITANGNDGIKFWNSTRNLITGNILVSNNDDGIQLSNCISNNITANNILANNDLGIYLYNASETSVNGNAIWTNRYGIELSISPYSTLSGNDIAANSLTGVRLFSSSQSRIYQNNVTDNYDGIYLLDCSGTHIYGNKITENVEYGLWLESSSSNIIIENEFQDNLLGAYIHRASSSNGIYENHFAANNDALLFSGSNNNIISTNTIADNQNGVRLAFGSSNNQFYHNNFLNNTEQGSATSSNTWDNGLEGNYWSIYAQPDLNNDGIGDTPITVATDNVDRYPLMGVFNRFMTSFNLYVHVISNSTVDNFAFTKSPADISITMHASNMTLNQTAGFCRVTIPHTLMTEPYNITIDDAPPNYANHTIHDDNTNRWIYFNYNHSTFEIRIHGTDTTPPAITVTSPESTAYPTNEAPLNFTTSEPTSWMGYSLNGQANVTITSNITLTGLSEGPHSVVVFANDTVGNMGASEPVFFAVDTTPPHISIISPQSVTYTIASVMLTFTVDEPTSWMGYSLDGQPNATVTNNITLTSLSEGSHSIMLFANDTVGNMGISDPVYFTIDTTSPHINLVSPQNATYTTTMVALTFTVDDVTSWIGYSLDGQSNVTITDNATLTGLSNGPHSIIVYANDTVGNMGSSNMVHFTVSAGPVSIIITFPQNTTYPTTDVILSFTVNTTTSWMGYSLNGQANVTITSNITLTGLSEGPHSVVVFANDTVGNMGASSPVYFTIDTTPPEITLISPQNMTYATASVMLTFTVDEPTSWMGYSLNGQANVTVTGNTTLTSLLDGPYFITVYTNDTVGNMASSTSIHFSIDTTPPDIQAVSQSPLVHNVQPENPVAVNATVADNLSGVKQAVLYYTNGNGTWVTVEMTNLGQNIWNGAIPAFDYCTWVNYTISAEDEMGNMITSEEVFGYQHQYHVVPEYPSLLILPLFMILSTVGFVLAKKKHSKKTQA